ncbi:MAG: hypothetical protein KGQ93_00660 [Cyanobacteria bacterium REEB459]|nr:hypothetical protein [Cyanobacteria bacterium REEB459]
MHSASQSDAPVGEPPSIFANVLGFIIAATTLILPLAIIGHFSSLKGLPGPSLALPATPTLKP